MTRRPHPDTPARSVTQAQAPGWWGGLMALGLGALVAATGMARGDGHETIITSHGFSNFGELMYPADYPHLGYVNPEAPKGGEIAVWASGTFDSMNPYTRKGRAGSLSWTIYERLMESTADDPYGSYCLLCESLEYPESQDWVIFHLRPEAKFADGTPLTAHDVVFTVDLFLEQGLPSFREAVKQLYKSVEAIDDHTVKFTFQDGVPRKGLIGQAGASIVFSQKWFEESGARLDEARLETSPASGPYMIAEVEPNRRIVYKRNPDYWGKDLPINVGRHNFDEIRVEYFGDAIAAREAFFAGEYTFRQETSSKEWATAYEGKKILVDGDAVKKELPNGNLPTATGFVFNLRTGKFDDIRVREAFQLMYNFTWTNKTLQFDLFAQRSSFWENTDLAASGVPEGAELELLKTVEGLLDDPSILTAEPVSAHTSGERQLDRRNFRTASKLLDEAGWITGDDGMRRKDGKMFKVVFLANSANPTLDRIVQPFIQNLRTLGIDAEYDRVDPAQFTVRERDFDFDMIYDGYRTGLEENLGISQRFGCEDAAYSLFNPAGYCSEAVDTLIEYLLESKTLDEMKVGIRAIDRVMRAARFLVPVWFNDKYWVAYYDMYEHPETLPPFALGHLDFWWYNAEKGEALKAAGKI